MKERKSDHIKISLEKEVEVGSNGFEDIELIHEALPEVNHDQIELTTKFLEKKLKAPLLIEAMTGGTEEAMAINEALAEVAEEMKIGIAVGSQRPAIEDSSVEETYSVVKKAAKRTLKIANLGAVQLNYKYGVTECQMAVDMIDADALALHLNPLQEMIQPEGNVNFADLLSKIRRIASKVSVPIIAKEVGCGMTQKTAKKLLDAGVQIIDIGGYGGTSWNKIESYRTDEEKQELSEIFENWGIPTATSLLEVKDLECLKIASGGIRTGIEAAKSVAMGADLVGLALPLLRALDDDGEDGVFDYLYQLIDEMKLAMMLTGARKIEDLRKVDYKVFGKTRQWFND